MIKLHFMAVDSMEPKIPLTMIMAGTILKIASSKDLSISFSEMLDHSSR